MEKAISLDTKEEAAAYLAGMIDADGTVPALPWRRVEITNTDWDIIQATVSCLDLLGIKCRVRTKSVPKHCSDAWVVYIGGRVELQKIFDNIPLRCSRKQDCLKDVLGSYIYDRIPRDVLKRLYYDEEMSQRQIATSLGRSLHNIQYWMEKYELLPRRRGKRPKIDNARQDNGCSQ